MRRFAAIGLGMAMTTATAGPAGATPAEPPAPTPAKATQTTPAPTAAAGKLPPEVAREMADAIVAINKSLGLESWPAHGVQPCIDRGGQGILAKDVTPADTRKCAAAAVEKGLPELGKSFVVAILMGEIGPVTVISLGTGEQAGWGAYSCDPARACKPMKINPASKWGKRLDERRTRACGDATTIWLPEGRKSCP